MKQTTLRLPEKLHIELKREARRRGLTLNAYIISVLWNGREADASQKGSTKDFKHQIVSEGSERSGKIENVYY